MKREYHTGMTVTITIDDETGQVSFYVDSTEAASAIWAPFENGDVDYDEETVEGDAETLVMVNSVHWPLSPVVTNNPGLRKGV